MHKFTFALIAASSYLFATTYPDIKHAVQRQGHYYGPGKYQGDCVLFFTNGSQWKVHPDDQSRCFHWVPTDNLLISSRKIFCCKWNHSFIIKNTTLNESVKAMLIDHGPNATYVAELKPSNHWGYTQVLLSDDSCFEVLFEKNSFSIGDKVYIVEMDSRDSFWNYALIKGTETNNTAIKAHLFTGMMQ